MEIEEGVIRPDRTQPHSLIVKYRVVLKLLRTNL